MISQLLALAAFLTALSVCLGARTIGERFDVMAVPDNRRKRHAIPTPQIGGFAILSGLLVWMIGTLVLSVPPADPLLVSILLSAAGLGLVGFVDDQRDLSPPLRIMLLLTFMGIAFAIDPHLISATLNWYSFAQTPISPWVYVPLMGLTTIGIVNSVNMADGQNGLVGSMFAIWSGCLILVSSGTMADVAAILLGLSLIFLLFNINGKIFLGDCGSYGVTFALGLLVVRAHAENLVSLETVIVWFFIPVMDCLRLMIARPLQGRSIFQGGRDHFHHRLIDSMGMRWSAVLYVAVVGSSSLIATLYPRFALLCLCALCAFYFSFARLSEGEVEAAQDSAPGASDAESATPGGRVVSLDGHRERR
jgi:UDP-GlcNAc:undecaprenyl-phosphate GlcNAc-1-phosphate transferase